MVDKADNQDKDDTEVSVSRKVVASADGMSKTTAPSISDALSNTMPIARKTVVSRPLVSNRTYLEIHGLDQGIVAVELDKEPVFLGRSPDCAAHLPLANVSREHAKVVFRNDEYFVEDLDSTNGTYVNGIRIKKCLLRNKVRYSA